MSTRDGSTIAWSLGVGWLGALALGAAGVGLTILVDVVTGVLEAVGVGPSGPASGTDIQVVTVTSMVLCLGVAAGGGWTLAGAPEGLTPRWLAGLAAGMLGLAAGAAVFAITLGLTPL